MLDNYLNSGINMISKRYAGKSMENLLHARDKVGVQDFVLLENYTNETAFVQNLRKRFQENLIYTYIGPVVVSVNPYKDLDLYAREVIKEYQNVNFYELPPHIFAIADTAFRSMRDERKDQCILISGESGAGKTEASKKLLQYLAAASHHAPSVENVKDRLLLSNPILEAFGNAKTNRNDNSSRFGKYMDVEFDFLGAPVGGHILNYLLEKSRVVHQNQGERNFHIFYQLLSGAKPQFLEKLQLKKDPSTYFYLSQGSPSNFNALNDSAGFNTVKKAMDITDFSDQEQQSVFQIVACVLHLGNVGFLEQEGKAVLANDKSIKAIAALLGCPPPILMEAVVTKTIEAKGELFFTKLTRDEAIYARDALAKALYERLFTWIVGKLNASLQTERKKKKSLMGLLDIYGFEVFEKNSFEQFCINYCNEKLQQLFIELTLKSEQEEYQKEGIQWESVDYFDNKIICDLVEERHKGIISVMDEECLRPGGATDLTFLKKLETVVGSHAHFVSHRTASTTELRKTIDRNEFRLVHYAGDVTYNVEGFLDKNNDLLFRDLKKAMTTSNNPVVMHTFKNEELNDKKRPHTAATQFKLSLSGLMSILMSKEPWYIRCIKPNDSKRPGFFDERIVSHQVKYLGLMENLRVRRAGFAYRRKYEEFLQRYKCLCPLTWPVYKGDPKEGVKILVKYLKYNPEEFSLGKSKIFIRFPRTLFRTEDAFQRHKHVLATIMQTKVRGFIARRKYIRIQKSVMLITSYWRAMLARQYLKRRRWAIEIVRKFIKGFILRHEPESKSNKFFLWNVKAEFLKRLSRRLPPSLLDKSWPPAPESCRETSILLRKLHKQWMAGRYMNQLMPERKYQLEQKVIAEELFKGKKSLYEQSVPEPFNSNRLSQDATSRVMKVLENNLQFSKDKIVYMLPITKYDRNGHRPRPRIVVVTKESFYLLDGKSFKLKQNITYDKINGFETSCYSDGFVVLKLALSRKEKGDLIIDAKRYLVEFILNLVNICQNKKLLAIKPKASNVLITHEIYGGKQGQLRFETDFNLEDVKVIQDKSGMLKIISPSNSGVMLLEIRN